MHGVRPHNGTLRSSGSDRLENYLMKLRPSVSYWLALATSLTALADELVDTVRTAGRGDIEKVSNFLLFSSSKRYSVQVPGQVSAGDSFLVQYVVDGKAVHQRFTVVDIAMRGDLCWLHSKRRTPGDTTLGDTIYVKPCARVR